MRSTRRAVPANGACPLFRDITTFGLFPEKNHAMLHDLVDGGLCDRGRLRRGGRGQSRSPGISRAIETYVLRSYNYFDRMVDRNGLPYFNVFCTDPAEAAHDFCDFGDVTSRQWQAAVMARHMTGVEARNEKRWAQNALSYIDPKTGLTGIPKTTYPLAESNPNDQSLILYALATAYADHNASTGRSCRRRPPCGRPSTK